MIKRKRLKNSKLKRLIAILNNDKANSLYGFITLAFIERVEADGGVVESAECVNNLVTSFDY